MTTRELGCPLRVLFLSLLRETLRAERKLVDATRQFAEAALAPRLKSAFETHQRETEQQADRLESIFIILGQEPESHPCTAISGLIEESRECMEEFRETTAIDAALIIAAQKIKHYEMAVYGSLIAFAGQLGYLNAVHTFAKSLSEERSMDVRLTDIAQRHANPAAFLQSS